MTLAYIFPGQGSQHPGMGKNLVENFPVAARIFEELDDALHFSVSRLCFEGSQEDLQLTENTQPAILAVSVALLRTLQAAEVAGIRALLLQAVSEDAKRFYAHYGFAESPIDPMTMMITLADLEKALGR